MRLSMAKSEHLINEKRLVSKSRQYARLSQDIKIADNVGR